jgi:hypothetical protein
MKFDKTKWSTKTGDDYPYRNSMLNDLVYNIKLKGFKKDSVLNLLGAPNRVDSNYLFYNISRERINVLTLHSKTLVIKLDKDNTVAWRKIHE